MSRSDHAPPLGWTWATIGEVCELNPKRAADLPDALPVSFVPMAAVDEAVGKITSSSSRPYGEVRKGYTHFADGDVLWAKITPCMENGKTAVARGLTNSLGCGTTEFFVLRSRGAVLPEFLHRFVRQTSYRAAARRTMQSAAGQARVPREFVMRTLLPVPPIAEQRRIVAKLDELFAGTRAARAALDATLVLLEQYRLAVLAAAFRGGLTSDWRHSHPGPHVQPELPRCVKRYSIEWMPEIPSTWHYLPVEAVAQPGTVVTYGIVLPGPEVPDGVPYVRQQDIESGRIKVGKLARTSPAIAAKHERSSLRHGDVLLCIIRHLRVAVVQPGIDGANITQGTVRIRPAPFIKSDYLAAYLSAPAAQEWMKRCYIGMAMPRINVKDARAVPVAIPPLAEQHEIMDRINEVLNMVERQVKTVRELTEMLDRVEESALTKAFRGELVVQDAADEPASVLLQRLRTADPPAAARGRRAVTQ